MNLHQVLGLRPAPEFEHWLIGMRIANEQRRLLPVGSGHELLLDTLAGGG